MNDTNGTTSVDTEEFKALLECFKLLTTGVEPPYVTPRSRNSLLKLYTVHSEDGEPTVRRNVRVNGVFDPEATKTTAEALDSKGNTIDKISIRVIRVEEDHVRIKVVTEPNIKIVPAPGTPSETPNEKPTLRVTQEIDGTDEPSNAARFFQLVKI